MLKYRPLRSLKVSVHGGDKKTARRTFPEIKACASSYNVVMILQKRKVRKERMSKCNCLKICMEDGERALSYHMDRTGHGKSDARFTCAHETPEETREPWSEAATLVPLPFVIRAASRASRTGT